MHKGRLVATISVVAMLLLSSVTIPKSAQQVQQSSLLFVATESATVSNTTTETTLLSSGWGSKTLDAGFWYVGRTARVVVSGTIVNTGTPTIRIRVKLGSVTVVDTTALGTTAITATGHFEASTYITCRSVGASGTVFAQGTYDYSTTTSSHVRLRATNTSTATINTTISADVDVTAQWGTANVNNTITGTNVIIEALN